MYLGYNFWIPLNEVFDEPKSFPSSCYNRLSHSFKAFYVCRSIFNYFKTMERTNILLLIMTFLGFNTYSQSLTEVTGIRFYEHHSSTINDDAPFGWGANGSQSGYDFVNNEYYHSFNLDNFANYLNGEEANIDMVEHNGPFGNGSDFGFTSGVSTIWGGDISGNGTTMWVTAPSTMNYTTVSDASELEEAYNAGAPSVAVNAVAENGVYIGKIRNSDLYVIMRCYDVNNVYVDTGLPQDAYFDFDYKYATVSSTSIQELNQVDLTVSPNPSTDQIRIDADVVIDQVRIYSLDGKLVLEEFILNENDPIDLSQLEAGIYSLVATTKENEIVSKKIVKK